MTRLMIASLILLEPLTSTAAASPRQVAVDTRRSRIQWGSAEKSDGRTVWASLGGLQAKYSLGTGAFEIVHVFRLRASLSVQAGYADERLFLAPGDAAPVGRGAVVRISGSLGRGRPSAPGERGRRD